MLANNKDTKSLLLNRLNNLNTFLSDGQNMLKKDYILKFNIIAALICIVMIVIFNSPYIFYDGLYKDDLNFYFRALNQQGPTMYEFISDLSIWNFGSKFRSLYWSQLALISMPLLRFIDVFAFCAIGSILFSLSLQRIFALNPWITWFSATIPAFLPLQVELPVYSAGAYIYWIFFGTSAAIYLSSYFLIQRRLNWLYLILFFISVMFAMTTGRQGVFFFGSAFIVIITCGHFWWRKIILVAIYLVFVIRGMFRLVVTPRNIDETVQLPYGEIVERLIHYAKYLSPIPDWNFIVFIIIMLVGFAIIGIILFYNRIIINGYEIPLLKQSFQGIPIVLFSLSWVVGTLFPFIVLSENYAVRYFYPSAYGVWILISTGIILLLSFKSLQKYNCLVGFLVAFIILISGISHFYNGLQFSNETNRNVGTFRSAISDEIIPVDAQIAVGP